MVQINCHGLLDETFRYDTGTKEYEDYRLSIINMINFLSTDVNIVVFPEYSIPLEMKADIATDA